jgi:hypothetical protein
MKSKIQGLIIFCVAGFLASFSEAKAQVSLMAHSNLIFVNYKTGYSKHSESTKLNLLPVSIGLEARVKMLALSVSGEAFSLPTADLILGGRVALTLYPFKVGPIEPFVTANMGLATGEDTSDEQTSGYGGGLAFQVSRKVQLLVQVRRTRLTFHEDIQLKNDFSEIAFGPKFSF